MAKLLIITDPEKKIDVGFISELEQEMVHQLDKAVVGYDTMKRLAVRCLLTNRHMLMVSVPGLGKTVTIMAMGQIVAGANAVTKQFVSDLMPSDIIGSQIYNEQTKQYDIDYGPLLMDVTEPEPGQSVSCVNVFGADEINRANPKMQSALLGAMQEKRVMIGKKLILMPKLFTLYATRNPIENEGTYDLPEAQLDRFAVEQHITYLKREDEKRLNQNPAMRLPDPHLLAQQATDLPTVLAVQKWLHENIYVSDALHEYVLDLVRGTRPDSEEFNPDGGEFNRFMQPDDAQAVGWGTSPRASQSFLSLAQAAAAADMRTYVLPKDVKPLAVPVLTHRMGLKAQAKARKVSVRQVIKRFADNVKVNETDEKLYQRPSTQG
jgi:MoxR-like ATPase